MKLLDQGISPLIRSAEKDDSKQSGLVMMDRIASRKIDILQNNIGTSQSDLIRPEIIESWIRSRNYGLKLYDYNYGPLMDKHAFDDLKYRNTLLIEAARPLLYQAMMMSRDSLIQLTDTQGVVLYVATDKEGIFFNRISDEYQLRPGVIWSEETVGTLSHTLSLVYGIPMQMCGPEHFSQTYPQNIASAAPIFDANNNIAGSVCLVNRNSVHENANSLALIISIAEAIQQDLHRVSAQVLAGALLESTDKSIITLSRSGQITNMNIHALRIFGAGVQDMRGIPIEEVLGIQPLIKSVVETRRPIQDAEISVGRYKERFHLHSARPLDDQYGNNHGYVLVLEKPQIRRKQVLPTSSLATRFNFYSIIGRSPQLLKSIDLAKRFARLDGSILIQGESGTGKEMFAQAIHNENRPNGPFIAINCASLPKTLIESELFGYEGGAFTGAERQGRKGKIELAAGGTLFLDEIGDMPLELQPALLRVLEEKQIMRIGGSQYIPVDFKLITATNQDLLGLIEKKQFREDLYYRLEAFQIHIPPLRERGYDVIELAEFFIGKIAERQGISAPALQEATRERLLQFHWPGNVRQLKNAVLNAVHTTNDGVIKPEDLPPTIRVCQRVGEDDARNRRAQDLPGEQLSVKDAERMLIKKALAETQNNIAEAGLLLGMSRSTLYRKVKKYQLLDSDMD